MDKIAFKNGQAPALSAETLNLLQQNIENAIEDVRDNLEQKIAETVLYKNISGTTENIPLNDDISNYSKFKIYGYFAHSETQSAKFCREFVVDSNANIELTGVSFSGSVYTYLATEIGNISGMQLTRGTQFEIGIGSDINVIRNVNGAYVYITEIVAYK